MAKLLLALLVLLPTYSMAAPLSAPGDLRMRHDLQLLSDSGVINTTLTAWPVPFGDIYAALMGVRVQSLSPAELSAYRRIRDRTRLELSTDALSSRLDLSGSINARSIRSFEDTPRDEGEVGAHLSWLGERFSVNLSATAVANPFDGDDVRPDGTYIGVALGNWIATAGWQERWWGPGRDGSLILSSNARPTPGVAIQRNVAAPFETRWLGWIGPWTVTSFMNILDDDRFINDARLFGIRGSFRPPKTGLEIGVSRTAMWCGDNRPCSLSTFGDLLLGNDNRGVNIDPADEPGNQLGGFDLRWSLPKQIPVALYMQWIGEDGRRCGGAIGAWLRQFGVEYWGVIGDLSYRTHLEVSDSTCREGGFGFSDAKPNCSYGHSVYRTGYRYDGRAIGHSADGDSLSYSFGSTLVQSAGHLWNISLRYMEINRTGAPDIRHTLTPTPQELIDLQIAHDRQMQYGRLYAGLGFSQLDDLVTGTSTSDIAVFIRWSSN